MMHIEKFIRELIDAHEQHQSAVGHVQTTLQVLKAGLNYIATHSNDPNLVQIVNDFSSAVTTEFFKILEEKYVLPRKVD